MSDTKIELIVTRAAEKVESPRPRSVAGEPLDEVSLADILAKLPPATEAQTSEFVLRQASQPPPRTGADIRERIGAVPADRDAPVVESAGVRVRRVTPAGEVDAARNLTLSFDRPVAPIGWEGVPEVLLAPEIEGRWRALGTSTLVLEPADRLPGSSDITVQVVAGATMPNGAKVAASFESQVSTSPIRLLRSYPDKQLPSRQAAVVVLCFDQRVEPRVIVEHLRFEGRLDVEWDIEALRGIDEGAADFAANAPAGTWVALLTDALPPGPTSITLPAGAASLEGPRLTTEDQVVQLDVAGPFLVTGMKDSSPGPDETWTLDLSNPIDPTSLDPDEIEVTPAPRGAINAWGHHDRLSLSVPAAGDTTYLLRLPESLRDVHGQPLSGNREFQITTTEATPSLYGGQQFATVLADAPRRWHVHATNLKRLDVSVYEVTTQDWFAFRDWERNASGAKTPPGTLLGSRAIDLSAGSRDGSTLVEIDLDWALAPGTLGHRVVVARPTPSHNGRWEIQPVRLWLQSTRLGVTVWDIKPPATCWVTELATGAPREGCHVLSITKSQTLDSAPTDADGTVGVVLPHGWDSALVATDGQDTCLVALRGSHPFDRVPDVVSHVFADRGMYRPGEEVTLSGWARRPSTNRKELAVVSGITRMTVVDAFQNEIAKRPVKLDENGRFEVKFTLPDNPALGHAQATFSIPSVGSFQHQFEVLEFRRPDYEVMVMLADAGPHIVGDEVTLATRAAYYTGEPLADAATQWTFRAKPTSYAPPGWPGFVFGRNRWPWFGWRMSGDQAPVSATISARTDIDGAHTVHACVPKVEPAQPVLVTGSANVTDVNRQTWSGVTTTIVHPSRMCVGVKMSSTFVAVGEALVADVVTTDLDGDVVPGRQVIAVLEQGRSRLVRGTWSTEWTEVQREVVGSSSEPVTVRLSPQTSGSHRIIFTTADEQDRLTRTEVDVWVTGAGASTLDQERLTVIPSDEVVQAPADAKFAIAAGFAAGQGRWLLLHHDVVATGSFELEDGSATLTVPVDAELFPRVKLQVDVVGVDEDGLPTMASGSVELPVWDRARRLDVEVEPSSAEVEPGGPAEVTVRASLPDGTAAAGGFATIWVVDEAILSLSSYETPDPIGSFYPTPRMHFGAYHSRSSILRPPDGANGDLGDGAVPARAPMMRAAAPGAAFGGGGAAEPPPIAVRTNFNPLATFSGVPLDEEGRARIEFDVPDSLTRYRVMVNAQFGTGYFGCGESAITARLPLMVRPSPPRFVNFGDRFELGVVVHNATSARCDVDVAVRASNLQLERGDHDGRRVTLAGGERAEVRFAASTLSAGEVVFDAVADTVSAVDAAAGRFPVYSPSTTEAAATYGTIDEGVTEHIVEAPANAVRQFGGLEITTSSTALQALTDAVIYLARYPYDCAEQRASRVLALCALRDVLSAFECEQLPSRDELDESVRADLQALTRMQNSDGGWGFWRRGQSWPVVSIHVVHALVQARESGAEPRPDVLGRGLAYLDQIERHLQPADYPERIRLNLRAYTAFVRTRAGLDDRGRAQAVINDTAGMDDPPLAAAAWCLPVLEGTPTATALLQHAMNRVAETEATAMFAEDVDAGGLHLMLGSNRRTDAVMLWALMDVAPDSQLIPKLVYGLLAHRKRGRWGSTQENAHVLIAMNRYFKKYESATPDFVARAWLGERFAGEHEFRGRTTDRHHVEVPMALLADAGSVPLVLQKDGAGRMYYRVGIRYALEGSRIEPLDRGFVVDRRYEAVDEPDDVGRRDDGTWVIRAGARVRVTVSMVAPMRRHHVALIDPLPAGLEALNPALAVTEELPQTPAKTSHAFGLGSGSGGMFLWFWSWRHRWYEHENLRDERVEAFTSTLWEGTHEYVYFARATTIGEFVVSPARAEEMYSPEVFGRSASDRVVVVEM